MDTLTEEEINEHFLIALYRIQEKSRLNYNDIENISIDSVTVPLNSNGELLSLSCNNADKLLDGESNLIVEYIVPRENIVLDDSSDAYYAKNAVDSEYVCKIKNVINDIFNHDYSLTISSSTTSTLSFSRQIKITDPTLAPIDEELEITPVIQVNIDKKYIIKKKDKPTVKAALSEDADMTLKPRDENIDSISFGDTVDILNTGFTVNSEKIDERSTVVTLNKDGETVAYLPGLTGNWSELIDSR